MIYCDKMNGASIDQLLSARRVLLLQGPMGSFFYRLSNWLTSRRVVCYKVNFNGGDRLFFNNANALDYRGSLPDFAVWLQEKLELLDIDTVICFGDCRLYHAMAKDIVLKNNKHFLVFEEGYLRPDYITLEVDGVNAHSKIHPSQILAYPRAHDHPVETNQSFALMVVSACLYYMAWFLMSWRYPFYRHHRTLTLIQEVFFGLRAFARRLINIIPDHFNEKMITEKWANNYFVVALQVHNDSQVRVHSQYQDVADFIVETIQSFAKNSHIHHCLVIKHHPMDRGYRHYGHLIAYTAKRAGIENRVVYVCDVHLPTILKYSLGLVTINSTTGMQALYHGKPVKTMGRAIYDIPRLTMQGSLDQFWKHSGSVDRDYYLRFRELLLERSQINGSFYGKSPWMARRPVLESTSVGMAKVVSKSN